MPKNIWFYVLLTIPSSLAVFQMVTVIKRQKFLDAQRESLQFLNQVINEFPNAVMQLVGKIAGLTGGFVLLLALTFAVDTLSDNALEHTKKFMSSRMSNLYYVQWQQTNLSDWLSFLSRFRTEWSLEAKKHKVTQTEKDFESVDLDKWQCRASRTLFSFSILFAIAGIIDIALPKFRRRGIVVALAGILSCTAFLFIWVGRENHYTYQVLGANQRLDSPVDLPPSLGALVPRDLKGGIPVVAR